MARAKKIDLATETGAEFEALMGDLAALKREMAVMARRIGDEASEEAGYVRSVVDEFGDLALRTFGRATKQGGSSARAIGREIGDRPVTSVLLVVAAAIIGNWLFSRR